MQGYISTDHTVSSALLIIFDIQEGHLKVWSYSQYPACNCSLLYHRENSQHQIQTFVILEQKAKDTGFFLCKNQKFASYYFS